MQNSLRDKALTEVEARMLDACLTQARLPQGLALDVLVNDTLHHERKRLESAPHDARWQEDAAFWELVRATLARASDTDVRRLLRDVIRRYCNEIRGNFSPALYAATTRLLPRALPLLLNAVSPKRLLARGLPDIADTVALEGDTDALRACAERGTVILAPTHVSNLDSPVMGWAIWALGLPAFSYGAGLNLFSNPVMSLFMRNLGAYRVDRQKTAPLYKDILKEYATISLELGQHNLFFPAGTRVRSGAVEQHLKLGLLSAGLRAYINNRRARRAHDRVYIVPCTLNYHLVLEAESLIEEHLQREGKARYIPGPDESYMLQKYIRFTQNLVNLDARIRLRVGAPIDPFGNAVDPATGASMDHRGRPIDLERYVLVGGEPQHLPQRDRVFTQQAGDAVAKAFMANTVALSTQIVAWTFFTILQARSPSLDLYRLLRTGDEGLGVAMTELCERVLAATDALHARAARGEVLLEPGPVTQRDAVAMVQTALRHFASYHAEAVLARRGDRVYCGDMKLLHYYGNRLRGHGLDRDARPHIFARSGRDPRAGGAA
jgi:glycerol-3-phosphate O-acyltransferase